MSDHRFDVPNDRLRRFVFFDCCYIRSDLDRAAAPRTVPAVNADRHWTIDLGLRLYPEIEAKLDAWIARQGEPGLSRPEAISVHLG